MTFQQMQLEAIDLHFDPAQFKPSQVRRFLNAAEIECWNAQRWVFKRVSNATLAVSAGSRTPTMPADFGKATRLYDDLGCPVDYLAPDEWERAFLGDTGTGRPSYYTVANRQVYLGPTPQSAYSFKFSYRRRYAHLNGSSVATAGVMSASDDTPLWDSEYHYLLVPWAVLLGGRLEGEALSSVQAERDALLDAMRSDLVGGEDGEIVQWGASC